MVTRNVKALYLLALLWKLKLCSSAGLAFSCFKNKNNNKKGSFFVSVQSSFSAYSNLFCSMSNTNKMVNGNVKKLLVLFGLALEVEAFLTYPSY